MAHLPLWYLGAMPLDDCDKAAAEYRTIPAVEAKMGTDGGHLDTSYRNSKICFTERDHWFGMKMYAYGLVANNACSWDYNVDTHEAVQYAEYGPGQHYKWHVDTFPLTGKPQDRKITVVCLLSDTSEFTEGQLQIRLYEDYTPELVKGSIIAFPSSLEHRVIPVTSGLRCSATMWLKGPRFR